MPEGDTLFRIAATLRKALLDRSVIRFESRIPEVAEIDRRMPVAGRSVSAVEARGKHLLIVLRFAEAGESEPTPGRTQGVPDPGRGEDDSIPGRGHDLESGQQTDAAGPTHRSNNGESLYIERISTPGSSDPASRLGLDLLRTDLVLHTHLRMTGSWHIYRPGEGWQKPTSYAKAVLHTEAFVAVCFSAPVVELMTARETVRHPQLARLGPDAIADEFDNVEALRRLRGHLDVPIGVAIMNQSLLAGVGNVYKSEVLFICRINPFCTVRSLSDEDLDRLVAESRKLLTMNRTRGERQTHFSLDSSQRLWAYGRANEPCRICGTSIRMRRQGLDGRTTYYCPACQGGPSERLAHWTEGTRPLDS